jgi:hypothetical protein
MDAILIERSSESLLTNVMCTTIHSNVYQRECEEVSHKPKPISKVDRNTYYQPDRCESLPYDDAASSPSGQSGIPGSAKEPIPLKVSESI